MLYLSLLTLPRRHPRWQYLQPYDLHRLLIHALPDQPEREKKPRLLYRHDEYDDAHSVLVQTPVEPDWEALTSTADVKVKSFDPSQIETDRQFRFLLRANPVVRRRGTYFKDGKARHVLVGSHADWVKKQTGVAPPSREEQLVNWLAEKGHSERGTLGTYVLTKKIQGEKTVPACVVSPAKSYSFRRSKESRPMYFMGVDFEGILQVTDPEAFARILQAGIGRGKAFGFGLLSLAPAR